MSLDFSVVDMKNYNVLTTMVNKRETGEDNRQWHPITNALIFATMSVGINDINEKNWHEFYERLYLYERIAGSGVRRAVDINDEKNYITADEVYMHIGLHTNASNKTKKQFLEDLYSYAERKCKDDIKNAPDTYAALELDKISEEEFQKAQEVKRFEQNVPLTEAIKRHRAGWTPEHEDGYLLGTTENIGSTVDN